jgi:hypothetical protein
MSRPRVYPCDRARIEQALDGPRLAALGALCEVFTTPRDRWPSHPGLRTLFEAAAVECLAHVDRRPGEKYTAAVRRAAQQLGIDPVAHIRLVGTWIMATSDRAG